MGVGDTPRWGTHRIVEETHKITVPSFGVPPGWELIWHTSGYVYTFDTGFGVVTVKAKDRGPIHVYRIPAVRA